jgi:hypothetical protein
MTSLWQARILLMIRRAIPIRFDRVADAGRNRPLLVTVETTDGAEHEVFLKFSGRPELGVDGLANELLAVCLAGDLGLPVNEPFLVELTPEWIAAIPDADLRETLEQSVPLAFASKSAGPQWRIWSTADTLNALRHPMALQIFAFDAYIENDDRRPGNPNCLVRGNSFRIIDHELAFRINQKLFPKPEPWRAGYLERFIGADGHIFGNGLRSRNHDLGPIRGTWSGLSDARVEEYRGLLPAEWESGRPAWDAALTHLRTVRDRIEHCIAELERALR